MANYFRSDGWVKSALGPAVPGSQIYICLQPANIASLPPSPLANIFSDPRGLVPLTQPIITDGFGHYDFYAQAGVYTLIVGLGGIIQQVYPDQSVGGGSAGGTAIVISVNGTPTANQFAANFQGAGSVAVSSDGSGDITITGAVFQTNGATNTLQTVLNLKAGANIALASDAFGGVTVTGTSQPGIPAPATAAYVLWTAVSFSGNPFYTYNDQMESTSSGGTVAFNPPTSSTNYSVTISGRYATYGGTTISGRRNFTYLAIGSVISTTFSAQALGMVDNISWVAFNSPIGMPTGNTVAFYAIAGATVWSVRTSNGAGTTNVVTAAPIGPRQHFQINYTPTSVAFLIDSVVVATVTTNLPTTGSMFMFEVGGDPFEGGDSVTFEYMSCQGVVIA